MYFPCWFWEAEGGDPNMWITTIFCAKNYLIILNFHFNPTIWPQAGINIMKTSLTRVTRELWVFYAVLFRQNHMKWNIINAP